jgi:L-ascorbate metabolism protein UlaG (beta-lactamase superfamily)
MLKSSLKNPALRKRAGDFTRLVRHSVVTARTGKTHKPQLVSNGELGVTFIGHSSFFLQIGGQNVVIDPNFARWLFVLKRLRQPGLNLRDLPPMDVVLVTHAHFDHLHRQSLRTIARQTRRQTGTAPTLVVPHHLFDLVSDLGFEQIVELEWWNTYRHGTLDVLRTRTAATAAMCCAAANTPSTTPETPPTSPASAKSDAACRPN